MNEATNYAEVFYSESRNDIEFLKKTVNDFPASSVARFLLLYHYKKNSLPGFEELAKQTGIYLNNPLWIQFQLSQIAKIESKSDEILPSQEQIEEERSPAEAANEVAFNEQKGIPEAAENKAQSDLPTEVNEQIIEIPREEVAPLNEESKEDSLPEIKEELPTTVNEQIIEIASEEVAPVDEESKEESLPEIKVELPTTVNEQITEIPSSREENNEDFSVENNKELQPTVNEEITETPSSQEENNEDFSVENNQELSSTVNEQITQTPSSEIAQIDEQNVDLPKEENPVEDKSVFDIKIPVEETNSSEKNEDTQLESEEDEEISFEPLHTVDYFASQGIKINEEALANDQLGKQVKSFTAWLKSMKKLHPGQLPEQNEVIEKIIQSSSEASNKDAHVLTEAMAEVLIKQGKRQKAIEMYEKLSLINPSKSAYFAAKIESLKII